MTFPGIARSGIAVLALHNAEEALTIPTWLPPRMAELEARFGIRPAAFDTERLYLGLAAATLIPALWIGVASRSAPRSAGSYSILVLFGVFLANAFVPHLLGTMLLGSYVPGVVTGLLVIPFTTWLIHRAVAEDYASARGVVVALLIAVVLYFPALRALLGV